MKILYGIQGTGNGHISRARDIIPSLARYGEVHTLVSGLHSDVDPGFEINYRCYGMGFIFGKKGGVDLLQTFVKARTLRFYQEIAGLPVEQYDLIVTDFEPVTAWACRRKGVPCFGLSHQAAVLAKGSPKPEDRDLSGELVLKYYCPTVENFGFHFASFDKNIYTPVIRQQIRSQKVSNQGHYTVYLPAYSDEKIFKVLSQVPEIEWQVFSKHGKSAYRRGNLLFCPISNQGFMLSLASCEGVLCGAGFETPAEALFMGKKVLAIPMKNQYEQQCNAAALNYLGIKTIKSLKEKHLEKIQTWVDSDFRVAVNYPDQTDFVIDELIKTANKYRKP